MPPVTEDEVIEKIQEGLALAVSETDGIDDPSTRYLTKTKLQKLVWLAVREFDEDVTYSWYLAGPNLESERVSTGFLDSAFEKVATPSVPSPDLRDERPDYEPDPQVRRYADFFGSQIPHDDGTLDLKDDVWYKSGDEFLEEFYDHYAPDEYHEVYAASIDLRNQMEETIRRVAELINAQDGGAQASLDSFGSSTPTAPDHYKEIGLLVSRMHLALSQNGDLEDTVPRFKQFTDILEDTYMMLAKVEVKDVNKGHLEALRRLRDFHYYKAWRIPALIVSERTATGPGASELRRKATDNLESLNNEYDHKIATIESYCAERGLLPDYTDYPDRDDTEMQALVDELADRYIRG
jgi:hypothetical protein